VERFAAKLGPCLEPGTRICLPVPWTAEVELPRSVMAPPMPLSSNLQGEDTIARVASLIGEAAQGLDTLIIPGVFAGEDEVSAACKLISLVARFPDTYIIVAQLPAPGVVQDREANRQMIQRIDRMLEAGADDIIIDAELGPAKFKVALSMSRRAWERAMLHAREVAGKETHIPSDEQIDSLQQQHAQMLWETLPHTLMPSFPKLERDILESPTQVGGYRFVSQLATEGRSMLLQAVHKRDGLRAIKVKPKAQTYSPCAVEEIYREYRFTSELLNHVNIARCHEAIHCQENVYLVFEYAGKHSLHELLSSLPCQRFPEEDGLHCFRQICEGLAHCHSRDIVHRNLSFEHVVVSKVPHVGTYLCKIVNFSRAMIAQSGALSKAMMGKLPFMAPEVASGRCYHPQVADVWSVGVMLLEMIGGLTSTSKSVPFDPSVPSPASVAPKIIEYFSVQGSHKRALATLGNVQSSTVVSYLQKLLEPHPMMRTPLKEICTG
jgi:hypothetical protein